MEGVSVCADGAWRSFEGYRAITPWSLVYF
jgi:hypothetical protein